MKRGTGWLHTVKNDQHQYCCLGVLCEVADVAVVTELKSGLLNISAGHVSYDGRTTLSPKSVIDWLGLTDQDVRDAKIRNRHGYINDVESFQNYLSILNDSQKLSFKQIAKKLRKWFDITD